MKTKKILFTKSKWLKTFCCFWCMKVWKRDVWKINHLQIRIQRSRNLTLFDWEKLQPSNLCQQEMKSWFIQALQNDVNSRLAGVLVLLKVQNTRQKFHHYIVNNAERFTTSLGTTSNISPLNYEKRQTLHHFLWTTANAAPLHCEQRQTFHQFIVNNVKRFTTSLWTTSNISPLPCEQHQTLYDFLVNNVKRFTTSLWTTPNVSPLHCQQLLTLYHFIVKNVKCFNIYLWTTPKVSPLHCEQRQTFHYFIVNNVKRFTTFLSTTSTVSPLHCQQ